MLESRILPYLGSFTLEKIKPTNLMKLYDMLEQDTQIKRLAKNNGERTLKPLSKKTILEDHKLISAMLHKAVYWQLKPYNPAERVHPPRAPKAQRRFYDDEQCKVLLKRLNELEENEMKYKVAEEQLVVLFIPYLSMFCKTLVSKVVSIGTFFSFKCCEILRNFYNFYKILRNFYNFLKF